METGPQSNEIISALLTQRQILIENRIDTSLQLRVNRHILYLNSLDAKKPITIFIDTGGGDLTPAYCIQDNIHMSPAPIHGIVIGDAFSAGFSILQACHKRSAYPCGRLMCHAPTSGDPLRIDDDEFEIKLKELRSLHMAEMTYFSKRTGKSIDQITAWAKKEKRFTAQEALDAGFLDEITRFPEIVVNLPTD